jgi:trk system potassium uptake protein TrkA
MTFGSGEVCLLSIETPQQLIGRSVRDLSVPGEVSVAAISRQGKAFIPTSGAEFRDGDVIHLVILADSMDRFKTLLGEGG